MYIHIYYRVMNTITITYTIKFEVYFAPNYKWLDGFLYNAKTGRIIKQVYQGGSIGYIIDGKFKTLKLLRKHLKKPRSIIPHFKHHIKTPL